MSTYPPDGMAAFQAGNYAEAIQIFNQAVKEEPDNSRLYNAIGMCYAKLNKKENARAAFESALMIDPDNVTYQRNIERIEPKPVPKKEDPKKPAEKKMGTAEALIRLAIAIVGIYIIIGIITPAIFGPAFFGLTSPISAPDSTWPASRDLLVRDIARSAEYQDAFIEAYQSGDRQYASDILSEWENTVKTQRASLLVLLVPENKVPAKKATEKILEMDKIVIDMAHRMLAGKLSYSDYVDAANGLMSTKNSAMSVISKT